MGKKPGGGRGSPDARGGRGRGSGGKSSWPIVLLGALVVAAGSYAALSAPKFFSKGKEIIKRVPGGERRPILPAALFGGAVARAYQVAREIPEVLDKLFCYCYCIQDHGHLSLLSCFAETHAAG